MGKHRGDGFAVCLSNLIVMMANSVLGHNRRSSRKHDWEDSITIHMVNRMDTHAIARDGSKIVNSEVQTETGLYSGGVQTLTGLWNSRKVFLVDGFKAAFMEWVIYDNISLRQSVSQWLRNTCDLVDNATRKVLPQSHNTTRRWIMAALAKEKTTIRTIMGQSGSRVSISFDAWTSNPDLPLFGVVAVTVRRQGRRSESK